MAKILWLDDEIFRFIKVKEVLEKYGHEVTAHEVEKRTDLEEKLEKELSVKECPYDLIMLDIMMPEIEDGVWAFKRVKEVWEDIPVVALSGVLKNNKKVRFMKANCKEYIQKPISLIELLEKINRIILLMKG